MDVLTWLRIESSWRSGGICDDSNDPLGPTMIENFLNRCIIINLHNVLVYLFNFFNFSSYEKIPVTKVL